MKSGDQQNQTPFKGKHGPLLIAEIGGNHEGDKAVVSDLDFGRRKYKGMIPYRCSIAYYDRCRFIA